MTNANNNNHKLKLSRCQRIRSKSEFAQVFDSKQSAANNTLIIYMHKNTLAFSRVGVCVGKKLGNAVQRNRFKRTLRQAFRVLQHQLPMGYDYVIIPRLTEKPLAKKYEAALLNVSPRLVKKIERKLENQSDELD
ncbi:MAG: ribonuclease P protein component [Phycisphaerae bacterium]|nr:ribonuclease P protein component [Phycisphaerae bacterium]